ncbi:TPA: hypothetical protein PCY29_002267 [Staphylococcus aureus]|nr:hypothetical protein [Staphylococcus aureus]HDG2601097.1 hypothetical protein [Staphylococcus aureus]
MNFIKKFKAWLDDLSIKSTIILTGIGITLFIAMQQAFVGSIATGGGTDIYAMAFALWFTVMFVTLVLIVLVLFVGYILKNAIVGFMAKRNKRKSNNH